MTFLPLGASQPPAGLKTRREQDIWSQSVWNHQATVYWPWLSCSDNNFIWIWSTWLLLISGRSDDNRRWTEEAKERRTTNDKRKQAKKTEPGPSRQLIWVRKQMWDEGVSPRSEGRRWRRASEGGEWRERARTETCVGPSAASKNPWCIRSHSINTTRSGWCQEDEEKRQGGSHTRPLQWNNIHSFMWKNRARVIRAWKWERKKQVGLQNIVPERREPLGRWASAAEGHTGAKNRKGGRQIRLTAAFGRSGPSCLVSTLHLAAAGVMVGGWFVMAHFGPLGTILTTSACPSTATDPLCPITATVDLHPVR